MSESQKKQPTPKGKRGQQAKRGKQANKAPEKAPEEIKVEAGGDVQAQESAIVSPVPQSPSPLEAAPPTVPPTFGSFQH